MIPVFSYTEYTSPSGNTQIYIVRRRRNMIKLFSKRKELVKQKCLGVIAIIVGLIGCILFPDDCGGALFACALGILRLIF